MVDTELTLVTDAGGTGLCTLDQLKRRLGITAETDDEALQEVIDDVSEAIAGSPEGCGRRWQGEACLVRAVRTHTLVGIERDRRVLQLPARPVVSITSLKEALFAAFADADALAPDEDYVLDAGKGEVAAVGRYWMGGDWSVEAVYEAGYTPPGEYLADGYVADEGEVPLPKDLTEACLQQCAWTWQRRTSIGLSGGSAQGGSFSAAAQDELLPGVKAICTGYRRAL